MSKQIDERVVSMRFDNKHFESNVQTSMSTLDKLKAKLNLSGASKGLENVNSAAKKVDMSGLAGGIETVSAKFSSLQVVGVTALANITNSAINAGKRFVESLTIAPIKDGFSEYELTLNAVQTTMSGTGKTAEEVEKQLKSLDEYADKTVYSTADMLNNLPKFTNAGVDLEKATTAMIGIANATALAGGDAGKASIAFYNLGQAIGTGYLTRMDYNSINNAGIATMEWKNQMVDAAIAAGTLTKAGDDLYAAGDKTFTLQQLFIDGLQEQWATTDVMMKVFGDYGDETTEIGKKAYSAAQDVKTFSQMMESLKATAGTGWKDTWQTIFGGLDEAKQFWTDLSNSLSGIITGIANWRNKLLNGALGKGFSKLSKTLSTITDPIKKTVKTVKGATTAIKNLGEMANRVIRGEFGNGKARFEALTKAGYNYYAIQNKVNEKLGYAFRYSDKLAGSQKELTTTEEELTSADAKRLEQLSKMSDEELENLGLTKKQIKALRELKKYVDMTGLSFSEFVENIDEIDGRWLLINSFKNVGQGLVAVFKALKDAWVEIFPPMTSDQLFNIIGGLHKFSTHLRVSEETAENLKRTLKGVFAALDIVLTIVGGPIKIAFKILMQLLKAFDLDILDVTAVIGDAIVKFRDWIDSTIDFTGIFKTIAPYIKEAIDAVKGWIDSVKPLEKIEAAFKKVTDAVKDFAKSIRESDIVQNIISGLTNGLKNGASKVWKAIVDLAKGMLEKIKSVLGIHSPSTEFEEVGENAVLGLANGLKGGISTIANIIKTLCSKMFSAFGEFDWSNISTIFTNIARLFPKLKIFTTISALGNIFAVGGKDVVMGFVNGLAKSASAIWEAITSIAKNVISKFKDILGIHSPSAVFFAIGGFIIAGLVGGLMSGSANIKDALTALGSWVINFFKGLDLGTVVAAGATIGALILIKKILDITDKFASAAKSVGGLADSLKNLADNFNTKLFGQFNKSKWELISEALLKMAIAIGILAASVIIMSMIEPGKLWGAVGALGVLIVALGALAGIIVGLMAATKLVGDGKSIAVIGNMLLKIAIAMGIMAVVAKIAGSMYSDDLKQGALAIVAFGGIIVALMWATKLLGNSAQISTIGGTLVKISYAIGIMLLVAKSAASMTVAELKQGIQAIAAFSGIIIALMAATRLVNGGEFTDKVGKSIFKIAGAIAIMLIVAKIAASMSIGDIVKGTLTIAAFSGIIIGLMKAAKTISGAKNVDKIGGAILKMAFAMTLMAIAAKIAASMSIGEIVQGTLAIAAFGGMVVGLMAATKLISRSTNIDKIGTALFKIAGTIGIMVVVAKIAATMSLGDIVKGTLVIAAFGGIIVGLMAATKLITGSRNIDKMGGILIKIAITIGVMAAAVALLSLINPERLAIATGALTILFGMLALVVKSTKNITKSVAPLIVLTAAIVILAGALYWVGQLPVEAAMGATMALSILMGTLGLVLFALGKMGATTVTNAMIGVVGLLALVGVLYLVVDILSRMQGIENAAQNAIVLGAFMGVLAVVQLLCAAVGAIYTATGGMAMLGLAGLAAMIVLLYPIIGALAIMEGMQNAMANMQVLGTLLGVMTTVLVVLAIVGPLALVGITALAALTRFIIAVGALAIGVGALMQQFPALQSFLDTGIPVLIQMAGALGEMIGAFVGGIAQQIASTLPSIGLSLSQFMVNATPFITGAKMVDETVLKGVGILAAAVALLTAVDLMENIVSFLNGGTSFSTLGTELSAFIMNAMPFIVGARMIDPAIMEGVKNLAGAILILTGANLVEQITSWLGGESSLASFGSQLGQLGTDLKTFVTNLGTFSEDQVTTIDCAGRAVKALANAASEIPNEGGLWGAIVGENSLATFSSALPQLGTDLKTFVTNLGTFSEDQVTTIDCAGRAIKALADAAATIPNEGGLWGAIVGDNSLATFGSKLPQLGTDLSGFIANLGTFDESSIATVDCAGRAIKALAEAAKTIPNEGGFWAKIAGDNSLATFGSKLPQLGKDIAGFVSGLGTFGEEQIATVNAACKAIKAIAALGKIDLSDTSSGLSKLGKKLEKFAEYIANFVTAIGDVGADSISSAIKKTKDLIDLAKTAAGTNVESLGTFGKSLKKVATDGVKGFVTEFSGESPKNKAKKATKAMLDAAIKGAEDKKSDVKKKLKSVAEAALKELESKSLKTSFTSAGKDLVTGFANGIKNNKSLATDAGSALGKAALKAAKEALDENSPSKEMYKVGDFAGQGFVNALFDYESKAGKAGTTLAESSIGGLNNAIAKISDFINSDIDAEPTIRPVLDLSDVRSGASAIGSMFSGRRTLAVNTGTVGTIAASMAGFQNGNNSDEIVSSIKALRKDMAEMPRESITIGGITYDGDSAVADAVQTLVRAAKMERRT